MFNVGHIDACIMKMDLSETTSCFVIFARSPKKNYETTSCFDETTSCFVFFRNLYKKCETTSCFDETTSCFMVFCKPLEKIMKQLVVSTKQLVVSDFL